MLDISIILIFGLVVGLILLQAHFHYFRTNNTDGVDLMATYVDLQLTKRYRK